MAFQCNPMRQMRSLSLTWLVHNSLGCSLVVQYNLGWSKPHKSTSWKLNRAGGIHSDSLYMGNMSHCWCHSNQCVILLVGVSPACFEWVVGSALPEQPRPLHQKEHLQAPGFVWFAFWIWKTFCWDYVWLTCAKGVKRKTRLTLFSLYSSEFCHHCWRTEEPVLIWGTLF